MGIVEVGKTCEKCNCTFTGSQGQRVCGRELCQEWLQQFVRPKILYQPSGLISTLWFKEYSLACGSCGKDFVRRRLIGPSTLLPLVCPYCRAKNVPEFSSVG